MALLKTTSQSFPWLKPYLISLLLLSLGLRFWGIHRFNTLVFDEVYFAKFAYNYLSWTPFFDGHPPLSKYLIAAGMWVGSDVPFGQSEVNGLVGGLFAPWTYRWLNALTGSLIPLVIVGLAYQLTRRRRYAAIAGFFAALDGLFLVESRYALNNVYLVIFGLLGLWCLLLSVEEHGQFFKRSGWLLLSGICFGASASVKWNGLWFLLAAYGLWLAAQVNGRLFQRSPVSPTPDSPTLTPSTKPNLLEKLTRLRGWHLAVYLVAIPCLTYILIWIPHLQLNNKLGFWADLWNLQVEILGYHERVGSGATVHPYCSTWFSWLVMWRPVAYFYKITGKGDPIPSEVALPPSTAEKVIYDIHAMGNPFLWWFSTVAIAFVLAIVVGLFIQPIIIQINQRFNRRASPAKWIVPLSLSSTERSLLVFLAVCYLANLLPWLRVTRCLFLYHYMGASVFASMALAWLVDRWLSHRDTKFRQMGIAIIAIVTLSFLFWLPVYLGLPLSSSGFTLRMWLRSWI